MNESLNSEPLLDLSLLLELLSGCQNEVGTIRVEVQQGLAHVVESVRVLLLLVVVVVACIVVVVTRGVVAELFRCVGRCPALASILSRRSLSSDTPSTDTLSRPPADQ